MELIEQTNNTMNVILCFYSFILLELKVIALDDAEADFSIY